MAIEFGVWRIDGGLRKLEPSSLDLEQRLEAVLAQDISTVAPNLMIIGRQEPTDHGGIIDLIAIDPDGNLVILELKRDRTPREIIAQVLDYGSWVKTRDNVAILKIFERFQQRYGKGDATLEDAFCKRFGLSEMPDELNESHQLVIVASSLDASTERIVNYLADEYDVQINAIFFQYVKDGDREYLCRAWLREPTAASSEKSERVRQDWNGEYYVSFGHDDKRDWEEARKYGFISAGGGRWYSNTLSMLQKGARLWANVPATGYVGVGRVVDAEAIPVERFMVHQKDGSQIPLINVAPNVAKTRRATDDPDRAEYLVRVEWLHTVPLKSAVKEKGFFGNQNTVARPTTAKWQHTVDRLKQRFDVTN